MYNTPGHDRETPRKGMQVKVYLVLQQQNLARLGAANRRIIAIRLTMAAAQQLVDAIPGTYIEKHLAVKS